MALMMNVVCRSIRLVLKVSKNQCWSKPFQIIGLPPPQESDSLQEFMSFHLPRSITPCLSLKYIMYAVLPLSLLISNVAKGQYSELEKSMKTGIHWIERPKIYEVHNSIRASKISALGSRDHVKNEYLSILNDVEQALNDARTSANKYQHEEVRRRIQELKPELKNTRKDVDQLRKSSLQSLDNLNVRPSNEFSTRGSKFIPNTSSVKRITPFKRPFVETRKTPATVMPSGRIVKKSTLSLNPIRWVLGKGRQPTIQKTESSRAAKTSSSMNPTVTKVSTSPLRPHRPNPRSFKREPLSLPSFNLSPKPAPKPNPPSTAVPPSPPVPQVSPIAPEPALPAITPVSVSPVAPLPQPSPVLDIPALPQTPTFPQSTPLPPAPAPTESQLPPKQEELSSTVSDNINQGNGTLQQQLDHIQQLISENDEILKNAQSLLDELEEPSTTETPDALQPVDSAPIELIPVPKEK